MSEMQFNDFMLRPEVFKALDTIHFETPSEVQKMVIPLALKGLDVIGMSQTGSGKTHAYLIPIFNMINMEENRVQAVIIVPTRELAMQVYTMARPFAEQFKDLRVSLLSGGFERTRQVQEVSTSPHIVIGTPGRIKDIAFNQHAFRITSADIVVLDEADMTLEAGFIDDVNMIAGQMKKELQMMAFSATMPKQLRNFLDIYMKNPKLVNLNKETPNPSGITHIAYPTRNRDRFLALENLIAGINPFMALIFVSEKRHIDDIYKKLAQKGLNVGILHGDLDSTTRKVMLKRIRNSEFQYVVASDIAARGLDIEGVTHIINYNLPFEEEFYFHRAGRTARAGQTGFCYTLYDKEEVVKLEKYMQKGVSFLHQEYRDGSWQDLKKIGRERKPKKPHPLNTEIASIVSRAKKQKIKPGYKKKMNAEIDKLKRKHRRGIIEKDIKRRITERAIERTKIAKGQGEE